MSGVVVISYFSLVVLDGLWRRAGYRGGDGNHQRMIEKGLGTETKLWVLCFRKLPIGHGKQSDSHREVRQITEGRVQPQKRRPGVCNQSSVTHRVEGVPQTNHHRGAHLMENERLCVHRNLTKTRRSGAGRGLVAHILSRATEDSS